jgi:nucleotide-binding universal stress UspA family protein
MTPSASRPVIVVGVDGSDPSKDALRWSLRQAELTDSDVHVVLAWHLPVVAYGSGGPFISELDMEKASAEVLKREVREIAGPVPSVPISTELVGGPPAAELLRAARHASLLVVGSRGHGAFAGMLLGSVGSHCVSHATCPVVVVRGGGTARTSPSGSVSVM